VIYRLNDRVPFVEAVGETSSTWKHLRSELSDTKPAYVIYNYEFVTPDGRKTSKYVSPFITSDPPLSPLSSIYFH